MDDADVIIPFRTDHGPRVDHLRWVSDRWHNHGYRVHVGMHTGPALWNKARAVEDAMPHTRAPVLIVADADVWPADPDAVRTAVHQSIRNGRWAVPHHYVHRLDHEATVAYKNGTLTDYKRAGHDRVPYGGMIGGGLFVVRRADYIRCGGLDPRFVGHTGEDEALGYLFTALIGYPWRGNTDLIHLYHPAQPTKGDPRVKDANNRRLHEYKANRGNKGAMWRRVREIKEAMSVQAAEKATVDKNDPRSRMDGGSGGTDHLTGRRSY